MKISPRGIDLIKKCEGFRSRSYLCPSGVPTIGYGHTKGVYLGMACAQTEAQEWLEEDLAYFSKIVGDQVQVPLNENQFSALVSFAFNVGALNFISSTLLKLLNQGDYSAVPDQLRRWVFGRDRKTKAKIKLGGLVRRRKLEAALWESK